MQRYAQRILASWLASFPVGLVASMISPASYFIIWLAITIPSIAAGVRRIHDSGHCGRWIICPIVNLVFRIIPGNEGANEYGGPAK